MAHEFTHAVTDHTSNLGYPDDQPSIPGDCLRRMNNPLDPALGANFRIPNHVAAAFRYYEYWL